MLSVYGSIPKCTVTCVVHFKITTHNNSRNDTQRYIARLQPTYLQLTDNRRLCIKGGIAPHRLRSPRGAWLPNPSHTYRHAACTHLATSLQQQPQVARQYSSPALPCAQALVVCTLSSVPHPYTPRTTQTFSRSRMTMTM